MKIVRKFTSSLAILALSGATLPAYAQDMEPSEQQAIETMQEMFRADPLTADQTARMPAANAVVDQIFPPGTYMKMMDETMRPMMDGMMEHMGQLPLASLLAIAGLSEEELGEIGEGTLQEMMQILDPAYQERQKLIADETVTWISRLMDTMEPSFRAGLSRAYAIRFSEAELVELNAFFDTPTGSHYASESMLIMTDPQVMAAMAEMMPAMFEMMPEMTQAIQRRMAELPEARNIEDLSEEERARLAELLGIEPDELSVE